MTDSPFGLPARNFFAADAVGSFRCMERTLRRFFPVAPRDYPRPLVPNNAART